MNFTAGLKIWERVRSSFPSSGFYTALGILIQVFKKNLANKKLMLSTIYDYQQLLEIQENC